VDDGKRTHCNDGSLVDDGSASIAMTVALWMTEAPASRFREACCVMAKLPIVLTLAEAERCGLSRAAVRHALARGHLIRVRKGLFADATIWQKTASDPALRQVLETRAAWLALDRRGWDSHYSAAVLNGLPVPCDQPAYVTISQATRPEGRRLYRPGLRLRTAQVDARDVGSEWSVAVLTLPEQLSTSPVSTALQPSSSSPTPRWHAIRSLRRISTGLPRQWSAGTALGPGSLPFTPRVGANRPSSRGHLLSSSSVDCRCAPATSGS
jgi:Transcriptional regulator, AbiEi antitoxin